MLVYTNAEAASVPSKSEGRSMQNEKGGAWKDPPPGLCGTIELRENAAAGVRLV